MSNRLVIPVRNGPPLTDHHGIEVDTAEPTYGDDAPVPVDIPLFAAHTCPADQAGKHSGGLPATAVLLSLPLAGLPALRGIDAV